MDLGRFVPVFGFPLRHPPVVAGELLFPGLARWPLGFWFWFRWLLGFLFHLQLGNTFGVVVGKRVFLRWRVTLWQSVNTRRE